MDLRFTSPDLHALDQIGTEILVCSMARDELPPRGVTGLVDWRLAGRLSRLLKRGFATGRLGEVLLVPGKPKLPFDKILVFGLGEKGQFEEAIFCTVIDHILETLTNLKARSAVVELPGRHFQAIAPQRAADILLERVGNSRPNEVWTLIEPAEAQKQVRSHMIQERRRVRREP